jgi:hypothetical protein
MKRKELPPAAVQSLRVILDGLDPRCKKRRELIEEKARFYNVSCSTVYRALGAQARLKTVKRVDRGKPRKLSRVELEKYCELIAAIKMRTTNKQGRQMSTGEAIRLLTEYGVQTPYGFVQVSKGFLTKSMVNRYLKQLGYGKEVHNFQAPSVRFQADKSNDIWQFDISDSDAKQIPMPAWVDPDKGNPTLKLFSIVDDRSGVNYQEYRCVYGEDTESVLLFLFNAMSAKPESENPFQGIPIEIYSDNGPFAKSLVFLRVMECLGIKFHTHEPDSQDDTRKTARSKGKVERAFRTVKEAHEVYFHFIKPETEEEANKGLRQYLQRYNERAHRTEDHSRLDDWLQNLPPQGFKQMCTWERFCAFAREPEGRTVGNDARISVDGVTYEVSPELACQDVILWWGLFDSELWVEANEQRYGPYKPVGGVVPLHRYRKHKKTKAQKTFENVKELSKKISISKGVITGEISIEPEKAPTGVIACVPFLDPFQIESPDFPNQVAAKLAISGYLGRPIGSLPAESKTFIAELVASTLNKTEVLGRLKLHLEKTKRGAKRAD